MHHSRALRYSSVLGMLAGAASAMACSSDNQSPGGTTGLSAGGSGGISGSSGSSGAAPSDGSTSGSEASAPIAEAGIDALSFAYTLIDDMETTTHGPIELSGITPPKSPGYWFNFGGSMTGDVLMPPYTSFVFAPLSPATTTYKGKTSAHAAHQVCALNGLYDVCGVGFEFAQVSDLDAGGPDAGCVVDNATSLSDAAGTDGGSADATIADASAEDAAAHDAAIQDGAPQDGGLPVCKKTIPFDISQYKGIAFWARSGLPEEGGLDVKVSFPDTDTDPRGGVCNSGTAGAGGPADVTQCYNNYAIHLSVTGSWQEYVVLFSDLKTEMYGYLTPKAFSGTDIYGINWQVQDNDPMGSPTDHYDLWVDDVYFIK